MIIDLMENWERYAKVHPGLRAGFAFLIEFDDSRKDGRCELADGAGYANVESYCTSPAEPKRFEAHKRYFDIQYLLSGIEMIQWAPTSALTIVTPYSEEKDAAFFEASKEVTSLVLRPRYFAIFFPSDAHKPGCIVSAPMTVRKIVVKIKI